MELTDQRDIAAPPGAVWSALVDPDVLKECIPGCQEMTGTPDTGYEAVVVQKVGPVKATFRGNVTLSNIVEGQSCTITGEGKGGPAGFAKGGADVVLTPTGDGTRLSYDVKAKVGGKLAQLGSRVIDGFAKKMADQFFDDFKGVVEGGTEAAQPAEVAAAPAAPAAAPAAESEGAAAGKKGWFKRLMG